MTPEFRDRVEKALAEDVRPQRDGDKPPVGWRLDRINVSENVATFVFSDPDSEQEPRHRSKWGVTMSPRAALNIVLNAM